MKKDEVVRFRVNDSDIAHIEALKAKTGITSTSEVLRAALRDSVTAKGVKVKVTRKS